MSGIFVPFSQVITLNERLSVSPLLAELLSEEFSQRMKVSYTLREATLRIECRFVVLLEARNRPLAAQAHERILARNYW